MTKPDCGNCPDKDDCSEWKYTSVRDVSNRCGLLCHPNARAWLMRDDNELIELLADLEHEQWMYWASNIAKTESISPDRLARWKTTMIPYSDLSEDTKEYDRVWARKAIALIKDGVKKE